MANGNVIQSLESVLQLEDERELARLVSKTDWSSLGSKTTNQALQLIGMYGFSGRTVRYEDHVNAIVKMTDRINLQSCALLELNELGLEMLKLHPELSNSQDREGNAPLHSAAERGNFEIAAALIEYDADPNVVNNQNQTPLDLALHAGPWKPNASNEIVSLLRTHGAELDFFALAKLGDHQSLKNLVSRRDLEIDDLDSDGRTALFHATRNNHLPTVEALLSLGANADLCCEDGQSPLSTACLHSLSQECDPKIIDLLIEFGAEETLPAAIIRTNLSLIRELVHQDPTVLDGQDHTSAIGYAIHTWKPESLKQLLELGCEPDERNWGHVRRISKDDTSLLNELRRIVEQDRPN